MLAIYNERDIEITRGDMLPLTVTLDDLNEAPQTFRVGDIVRFKVFEKKNASNVVLVKDFAVEEETNKLDIVLTSEDMKIGDVINKHVIYWYEVELNPDTPEATTIIGYTVEQGAPTITLLVEGGDK